MICKSHTLIYYKPLRLATDIRSSTSFGGASDSHARYEQVISATCTSAHIVPLSLLPGSLVRLSNISVLQMSSPSLLTLPLLDLCVCVSVAPLVCATPCANGIPSGGVPGSVEGILAAVLR